jgi:signal transduction histidine kinase
MAMAGAALLSGMLLTSALVSPIAEAASAAWVGVVFGTFAVVLRRLIPSRTIQATTDVAKLAGLAAGFSLLAAAGYVGAFVISGDVSTVDALHGVARYWFADLNGILMVTPLLMAGDLTQSALRIVSARKGEIIAQLVLILILLAVNFLLPIDQQLRFFYLLFVPVIWIALRWGWQGALPGVLVIQTALVIAAGVDLHTPRFVDTQILMLTLTLTALLLGSVVSERRRSEQELRSRDAALAQAMRFAVAGELSSALAHELNQPITAVVSYLNASKIIATAPQMDPAVLRTTLSKAGDEALRASEVLRKLRNHYIGGPTRVADVDVSALCRAVASAFADRLRITGTRLDVSASAELPRFKGDETQIEIVLHNLLANAIDATSTQCGSGRIIELRATADPKFITISVEDTGRGISADVVHEIFEPFITSKPDGMGLGLAISRSLIRGCGGELTSATGSKLGGARFIVTLPLSITRDSETA